MVIDMVCKNVEEYIIEYEKLVDEIKNICTNRACTLGTIQKILEDKGTKVSEGALLTMTAIGQIEGMMTFSKSDTYDIGDVVTYLKGKIFKSEMTGNLLMKVSYRKFYLYNAERYKDDAFREHIQSKLDFEVHEKDTIKCTSELENALNNLDISIEKWQNYVFINEDTDRVSCIKKDTNTDYSYKKYLGMLVRRT